MGKAMIALHALRPFADRYDEWLRRNPGRIENGTEIMVPVKHLRIAYEIIEEQDAKKEK